jgi:branched-chain amino acid transport system ATP-binding protein
VNDDSTSAENLVTGKKDILIAAQDLSAGYGQRPMIHGVDIEVREGELVTLLGPNGAGKSTTLFALAGELTPMEGEVVCLGSSKRASVHKRARSGVSFVPEERSVFSGLSVADNLLVGGVKPGAAVGLFPELEKLMKRPAGLLSGGEQQMLTLARALARKPRILLADELSLGLAPLVVGRLLEAVRRAADEGVGVLLVEQHSRKALSVADRAYVMRQGRIVLEGSAEYLGDRTDEVEAAYLGSREGTSS